MQKRERGMVLWEGSERENKYDRIIFFMHKQQQ